VEHIAVLQTKDVIINYNYSYKFKIMNLANICSAEFCSRESFRCLPHYSSCVMKLALT
jgi:hypothetical protein